MAAIDDFSDAQLRRLYRDVMAQGDPFEDEPLATDWRAKYVDQRGITQKQVIGRWRLRCSAWKTLAILEALFIAITFARHWIIRVAEGTGL